jgi:hypothetical protein
LLDRVFRRQVVVKLAFVQAFVDVVVVFVWENELEVEDTFTLKA